MQVPVPDEPLTLVFIRPDDGTFMYKLHTKMTATISDVKRGICLATGLKERAMIIARGKMGQPITDSQDNLYHDDETLHECGFSDGEEVGYMYLGDAAQDLAGFVPSQ